MRVPQVNERVKQTPAQALRAVFAGIGQLLSVSDKLRNKPATAQAPAEARTAAPETATPETVAPESTVTPETVAPESTVTPETVVAETATPQTVAPETNNVPATAGGHVKLLPTDEAPVAPVTVAPETVAPETVTPESTVTPETVTPESTVTPETVTPESTVTPEAAGSATAAPAGELPVPNYDDLSIASLRARLRNLTGPQVAQLLEYEQSHAARADVITMFERRIAKLAEG